MWLGYILEELATQPQGSVTFGQCMSKDGQNIAERDCSLPGKYNYE